MGLIKRTSGDYLQQMQALLPRGLAWSRDQDAWLTKLLDALAQEFGRIDARFQNLLDEADPRTTYELLPEWEASASLPSGCAPAGQTYAERRAALVATLTERGGQSASYFESLARSLGYLITITGNKPRQFADAFGADYAADEWWWIFDVNAEQTAVRARTFNSPFGEPYATWGFEMLECAINHDKHSHRIVRFIYGSQEVRLMILLLIRTQQQGLLDVQLNPLI